MRSSVRRHLLSCHKKRDRFEWKGLLGGQILAVLAPDRLLGSCIARAIELRLSRHLVPLEVVVLMGLNVGVASAEGKRRTVHQDVLEDVRVAAAGRYAMRRKFSYSGECAKTVRIDVSRPR